MQLTATQVMEQIKAQAESIRTDKPQRFSEAASVGDFVRQGDLYITRIEAIPSDAVEVKVESQLASGSTRGSRHILSHDDVKMYRIQDDNELTGPLIRVDTEVTVTHPEHGDWVLPVGCYSITYQRAFADELRRVRD